MLQKVTIAYFKDINGNIFPRTEDVLIDAPDGDSAASLARQAHGPRLLGDGALCETDEHGQRRLRMAVMGVETPTAADIERLSPKPEPVSEATKAGEDIIPVAGEVTVMKASWPNIEVQSTDWPDASSAPKPRNKGGRPKGSRNRAKEVAA